MKNQIKKMKERFHLNEVELREKCHQNDVLLKALAEIHSKDEFSPILNLCLVFEEGKGVEQDLTKTVEFYEMSAGQGNSHAFVKLGNMYIKGKTFEVNYPKSFKYFNQSAKLGNSEALVNIGQMYEKG